MNIGNTRKGCRGDSPAEYRENGTWEIGNGDSASVCLCMYIVSGYVQYSLVSCSIFETMLFYLEKYRFSWRTLFQLE